MDIPETFLHVAAVFFDVVFVLFVAYVVFVLGIRVYWNFKSKRMKGRDVPLLEGEFSKLKRGKGVIYFYAPNCRPCKMVDPIVKKLSKEFKKVHFLRMNVMETPEVARKFGVLATPSIVITENGKIKEVLLGPVTEGVLRSKL